MSGTAKLVTNGNKSMYQVSFTIHGEDKYNFNPGMHDIATGVPDSDNGRFELTGLGKQFMQYGSASFTMFFEIKKEPVKK